MEYNHPALDEIALQVEDRYGLPRGVVLAVKNAAERSNSWQVSPKGAKGVMQFIDSTREQYPHDPGDPAESIDAAGQYLRDLIRRYGGNVMAALAHYNGGGAAARAVLAGGQPPAKETQNYLVNIRNYMQRIYGG